MSLYTLLGWDKLSEKDLQTISTKATKLAADYATKRTRERPFGEMGFPSKDLEATIAEAKALKPKASHLECLAVALKINGFRIELTKASSKQSAEQLIPLLNKAVETLNALTQHQGLSKLSAKALLVCAQQQRPTYDSNYIADLAEELALDIKILEGKSSTEEKSQFQNFQSLLKIFVASIAKNHCTQTVNTHYNIALKSATETPLEKLQDEQPTTPADTQNIRIAIAEQILQSAYLRIEEILLKNKIQPMGSARGGLRASVLMR